MCRLIPRLGWFGFVLVVAGAVPCPGQQREQNWFDRQTTWNGFEQFHFEVTGRAAYLVAPKQPLPGRPWIWRARFPGYHAEMDIALLGAGFHVGYVDVAGLFGGPRAMEIGDDFYEFVTTKRGLSMGPCLEGVSRGGLFVYNWAAKNPGSVAAIYCDTPVCDFKSWPGGKGDGLGSNGAWQQCLKAYGLTEPQALQYERNPVDHAAAIAAAKIPLLHIVSENDRVVPPKENTYLLQQRLKRQGHQMQVISVAEGTAKSNGHHFDHPEVDRVVAFLKKHGSECAPYLSGRSNLLSSSQGPLRKARRVVFLGDSITYAGHYVSFVDAWMASRLGKAAPLVIDAGLPSETVSGLSEEGHAGGKFPRPDLAERLQRVLDKTKPDLVVACYGINCAIYQPLDAERFRRYREGITALKRQVETAGAKLVLLTPPCYDDQRAKRPFSYNAVLGRYAEWLLRQRDRGWLVIDLHGAMTREVARRRKSDPKFTFQRDAVHPDEAGHWLISQTLIRAFGDADAADAESPQKMLAGHQESGELLKLVRQRMALRRDAYLSASGHKRPGIRAGAPVEEAERRAQMLTQQIQQIVQQEDGS